jgi:cyclo(L-tyrosyl-L-tyrosyl) synthase
MQETPVTPVCAGLFNAREHAVIGISPFNSYFSEEKIGALIRWAKENFSAFHIYVPDGPSQFTLEALGYPEGKARKKASRQARWLFNKIRRGLDVAGYSEGAFEEFVLCSKALDRNQAYRRLLADVDRRFENDMDFRSGCIETSKWVLNGQAGEVEEITPCMAQSAVRYFKAELPLFMNSAELVGVSSSVFVYQQCPSFLEKLLLETRGEIISAKQGFVKVTTD